MISRRIYPVILCGGSGTRLWPLSRKHYPKQFVPLAGEISLFQATLERLSGTNFAPPIVVTGNDFRFIVAEQLQLQGMEGATIVVEPDGRNTAPAALAAALWVQKHDPDAYLLLSPADHVMPDKALFASAVDHGLSAATNGDLVTFGIKPDRAETGYGWLELATPEAMPVVKLAGFKEKPNLLDAQNMLASGRHLWNAGIFLFSIPAILRAFDTYQHDMLPPVQAAVDGAKPDLDFFRLDPDAWKNVDSVSIDYAIMERADNVSIVPYEGRWSDMGGWDAVWRASPQDEQGVSINGPATAINCKDTLLRSEIDSLQVVGIGLKDTIVVAMQDAVLVADSANAQQVKEAVATLKRNNVQQAERFLKDHRPWGWFETLALDDRYQVKKIVVKPGGILSLQSHMHRAEHWIVVTGTARVTIDETVQVITENQSVYIPLGSHHRMENPGKLPMVLIEVQTGSYLGEDDIIRYEDLYSRD